MSTLLLLLRSTYENWIRNIGGPLGVRLRRWYYSRRFGKCGKNLKIDIGVIIASPRDIYIGDNVWIDNYVLLLAGGTSTQRQMLEKKIPSYTYNPGELHIGDNVHVAPFCVLQAHGGVSIGKNTGIASGAKIYSLSHHYRNLNNRDDKQPFYFTPMAGKNNQFLVCSPVVIGEGAAIGLNSTILPGTYIPKGTWVGVQTFVHGTEIREHSVYAGKPADFVKQKN